MPPSEDMPLNVHHCWRGVYDYSMRFFTNISGYNEYDARLTADAIVEGYYTPSGRRRAPLRSKRLPKMGGMMELGTFKKIWVSDPDGNVTIYFEDRNDVPLLWSQTQKCCAVFPGIRVGDDRVPTAREDRLMRMWQRGRAPKRSYELPCVPEPEMKPGSIAIAVEYHSDKFARDGKITEYVHHHDEAIVYSESIARRPNGDPVAGWLRGGDLRITADGLEG